MTVRMKAVTHFSIMIYVTLILVGTLSAQTSSDVASLYSKEGIVEGEFAGKNDWKEVAVGQSFDAGHAVRVGKHGRAGVLFVDGMLVRLANSATIRFQEVSAKPTNLHIDAGKAHILSRKALEHPQIKTPLMSAAIRGTEFVVEVDAEQARIKIIDGAVECSNEFGSATAGKGEQIITEKGKAPRKEVLVNPFNAVQWALAYPSIFDISDFKSVFTETEAKRAYAALAKGEYGSALKGFQSDSWQSALGRSLVKFQQGDVRTAHYLAEGLPVDSHEIVIPYQASLLFALGLNEEAEKHISSARPSSAAYAVRAMVMILKNQTDSAMQLLQAANSGSTEQAALLMAQAYYQQSQADLPGAIATLERLLTYYPQHLGALVLLAEVELGNDNVEKAAEYVQRALAINPNDSSALAVSGFIALFKFEADTAEQAFTQALQESGGAAYPHFGLGLVYARKGDLTAATQQFEKAAHLEPTRALYRSYLGKAFFEDTREEKAGKEYELAIELDEKDPTPYLYRSLLNLSQNKVVKALEDVETSVELNQNRAVYRSRMMLDRDLGMRSAGLAQVFNEIGFKEAARVEAIKAVNKDYLNFSAHRFLADSYDTTLEADALLSERNLANLLAPLSFNFINSIGGEASLNEYDALFDKDEQRTGIEGSASTEYDRLTGEIFHTGRTEKFGYFLGSSGEYSGGSKDNRYLRLASVTAAGQYQADYKNRFILEGEGFYTKQRAGLEVDDAPENRFESYTARLGFTHRISGRSRIINQFTYEQNKDTSSFLETQDGVYSILNSFGDEDLVDFRTLFLDTDTRETIDIARLGSQHIFSGDVVSSVAGVQLFWSSPDRSSDSLIIDDSKGVFNEADELVEESFILSGLGREFNTDANNKLFSGDAYWYGTIHLADWIDATIGGSGTLVERDDTGLNPYVDGTTERSRFNPKIGVTAYPMPELLLRASYFEGLRKSILFDQVSLEPTLVSGLNQRFNDFSATRSRNAGVGLDYKLPSATYVGAEFFWRDLREYTGGSFPIVDIDYESLESSIDAAEATQFENDSKQLLGRAYAYQVLTNHWVGAFDYRYFDNDYDNAALFDETGHRTGFSSRYFMDNGLSMAALATWRQQDVDNIASTRAGQSVNAEEDFWQLDLIGSYRLPKRHGTISIGILNVLDQDHDLLPSGNGELVTPPQSIAGFVSFATNF